MMTDGVQKMLGKQKNFYFTKEIKVISFYFLKKKKCFNSL